MATANNNNQQHFRLFDLPPELRNIIYDFISGPLIVAPQNATNPHPPRPAHPLLLTCHQVRYEAYKRVSLELQCRTKQCCSGAGHWTGCVTAGDFAGELLISTVLDRGHIARLLTIGESFLSPRAVQQLFVGMAPTIDGGPMKTSEPVTIWPGWVPSGPVAGDLYLKEMRWRPMATALVNLGFELSVVEQKSLYVWQNEGWEEEIDYYLQFERPRRVASW